MKSAMRAKDSARLSAIRLILAAIKQKEVDERVELTDADVVSILEKMIKQRRESIVQFEKAARTDLADAEKFELESFPATCRSSFPIHRSRRKSQKPLPNPGRAESRTWARSWRSSRPASRGAP